MKRYLLILLSLIVFVPSVVSAAWWNPISWFKNGSTETKTEILEKRIQGLENKLQNTTSTEDTKMIVPTTTPNLSPTNRPIIIESPKVEKCNSIDFQKKIDALISENNNLKVQLSTNPTEKTVCPETKCDNTSLVNKVNDLETATKICRDYIKSSVPLDTYTKLQSDYSSCYSSAQKAIDLAKQYKEEYTQLKNTCDPTQYLYYKASTEKCDSLLTKSMSQVDEFSNAVTRLQTLSNNWKTMYYGCLGQPIPN